MRVLAFPSTVGPTVHVQVDEHCACYWDSSRVQVRHLAKGAIEQTEDPNSGTVSTLRSLTQHSSRIVVRRRTAGGKLMFDAETCAQAVQKLCVETTVGRLGQFATRLRHPFEEAR